MHNYYIIVYYRNEIDSVSTIRAALYMYHCVNLLLYIIVYYFAIIEMQKESQAKSGKQQQRSDTIIRMLPTDITLHEEILLETWNEFDPRLNRDMYSELL